MDNSQNKYIWSQITEAAKNGQAVLANIEGFIEEHQASELNAIMEESHRPQFVLMTTHAGANEFKYDPFHNKNQEECLTIARSFVYEGSEANQYYKINVGHSVNEYYNSYAIHCIQDVIKAHFCVKPNGLSILELIEYFTNEKALNTLLQNAKQKEYNALYFNRFIVENEIDSNKYQKDLNIVIRMFDLLKLEYGAMFTLSNDELPKLNTQQTLVDNGVIIVINQKENEYNQIEQLFTQLFYADVNIYLSKVVNRNLETRSDTLLIIENHFNNAGLVSTDNAKDIIRLGRKLKISLYESYDYYRSRKLSASFLEILKVAHTKIIFKSTKNAEGIAPHNNHELLSENEKKIISRLQNDEYLLVSQSQQEVRKQ